MADTDRIEQIKSRAYELWEQEGRQEGQHEDHWHRAAHEIASAAGGVSEDEDRAPNADGTGTTESSPVGETMPLGGTAAAGSAALATGMAGTSEAGKLGNTDVGPVGGTAPGITEAGFAGSVLDALGVESLDKDGGSLAAATTSGGEAGKGSRSSATAGASGTGSKNSSN